MECSLDERGAVNTGRYQVNLRYFLFLSLGLTRAYPPQDRGYGRNTTEKLLEPARAKACRRNILALAGVVVVAGVAGADPSEISMSGVKPSGDRRVLVPSVTVILSHLYWYSSRYQHMKEDGVIEQDPALKHLSGQDAEHLTIAGNKSFTLVRKGADLLSNYAAIELTCSSWFLSLHGS